MTERLPFGRGVRRAALAAAILVLAAGIGVQGGLAQPVRAAGGLPELRTHPLIAQPVPQGPSNSSMADLGWNSQNWSGYAVESATSGTYTAVTGCWTVPSVPTTAANVYSSVWVGIDGINNQDQDLIQAGTEQAYYGGSLHYLPWWEILPAVQTTITAFTIAPGNLICASVTQGSEGNWTIAIQDVTTGGQYSTVQAYSGPQQSAEWIVERPEVCNPTCVLSTLADYGQTTFYPVSANGADPDLVAGDAGYMTVDGTQVSTPSGPNADGDGFSVAYGPTAPSPPATQTTPTISSVSPSSGPAAGWQAVAIRGSGFEPGATVQFGANPAPRVFFDGPDELTALTPAGSDGAVTVTVSNPSARSGNEGSAFTYVSSPGPLPTSYAALQPYRICDTRSVAVTWYSTECSGHSIGKGSTLDAQVAGVGGPQGQSVPSGAQSVVLNVTAISGTANTFLTVFPAGEAVPTASNLNVNAGVNQANLVVVPLGAGGQVAIYNSQGSINVAVDVQGYFAAPSGSSSVPGLFHPIAPLRICDSRSTAVTGYSTECSGDSLGQGQWEKVVVSGCPTGNPSCTASVPTNGTAEAVALNLTAVFGSAGTFLSVVPPNSSDQCPTGYPAFSNLNVTAGYNLPNRVIVPLGPQQDVCVYNNQGAINFILDVNGWFGNGSEASQGAYYYAISPLRLCDTRSAGIGYSTECSGETLGAGDTLTVPVAGVDGLPAAGGSSPPVAVIANVTAVFGTAYTFFTLYPSDVSLPNASDLNVGSGENTANLSIVKLATTGASAGDLDLFNDQGSINAIVDIEGWFA